MFPNLLTLTALLSLSTTALAAPPNHLTKRIAPNTQSCTAVDHGLCSEGDVVSYGVTIGIAYNGDSGCDDVYHALESATSAISNWKCQDDGSGNTQLYFNCVSQKGDDLNGALIKEYPTISGGFNCPDC